MMLCLELAFKGAPTWPNTDSAVSYPVLIGYLKQPRSSA
jgi:hypothetical protein